MSQTPPSTQLFSLCALTQNQFQIPNSVLDHWKQIFHPTNLVTVKQKIDLYLTKNPHLIKCLPQCRSWKPKDGFEKFLYWRVYRFLYNNRHKPRILKSNSSSRGTLKKYSIIQVIKIGIEKIDSFSTSSPTSPTSPTQFPSSRESQESQTQPVSD